jgi:uncharacterized protein YdeI (YjbR/CyaY-like superfamily)
VGKDVKITRQFAPDDRAAWRAWLAANHDKEQEVWVVYFKPASGRTGIDYDASVEEALCFGWIDSIIQKIDEEKYVRKFNPRRDGSTWSPSNIRRVEKLVREGRMTPIGLAKYHPEAGADDGGPAGKVRRGELPIPDEIVRRVMADPEAGEFFQTLPPSLRRQYMSWVISAKKDETRERRLVELISTLARGKRLGLK